MHIPTKMVPHEVASHRMSIEQIELRALALEEVQTMDGSEFVIYFDEHDYEIVCVDNATGFEYNPITDIFVG